MINIRDDLGGTPMIWFEKPPYHRWNCNCASTPEAIRQCARHRELFTTYQVYPSISELCKYIYLILLLCYNCLCPLSLSSINYYYKSARWPHAFFDYLWFVLSNDIVVSSYQLFSAFQRRHLIVYPSKPSQTLRADWNIQLLRRQLYQQPWVRQCYEE